ncbi:interleukin-10 receptor subunit alpha isoform X2 [Thamnophis elegans]|uniref:interleukin-10 receptor subunit alpha isoform X2 n=1 Tax=Thamnophis elegans TaxID=35005 RepID=UPI001378EB96|nr:interleukin-10 receptor subunit alpha isoform X2 [Thamnophis elegans]
MAGMGVSALLLLLLLLPPFASCLAGHGGERILAAPTDAHFQARLFHHLLRWEPGPQAAAAGVLYEVQYRRLGNDSWRAAANCTRIALTFCDLTCETQQPAFYYLARVRAVAGNSSSAWNKTRRFTPSQATLWLSKVTLSRSRNQIHVSLRLPTSCWANLSYEGSYEAWGEYLARVRRVSDDQELLQAHSSLEFDLPLLLWGEEYCISVKPRVTSRPNPANWTEEQCVSIPPLEEKTVLTPSLALLTLLSLGILGAGLSLASAYKKKPTRMPSVLKSPLGHSFCWGLMEQSEICIQHMETESIQQLFFLGPQDHAHLEGRGSPCTGAVLPEKNGRREEEGRGLKEGSGCSADSGICLQEISGSLDNLHFTLDIGQEAGVQKDAGSSGINGQPLPGEGSPPEDVTEAHFSGYKQQSGAPLDCLGPPSSTDGELLLTTGYLKQTFLGAPPGLQGAALPKDFLHRLGQEKEQFPSSLSPDVFGP